MTANPWRCAQRCSACDFLTNLGAPETGYGRPDDNKTWLFEAWLRSYMSQGGFVLGADRSERAPDVLHIRLRDGAEAVRALMIALPTIPLTPVTNEAPTSPQNTGSSAHMVPYGQMTAPPIGSRSSIAFATNVTRVRVVVMPLLVAANPTAEATIGHGFNTMARGSIGDAVKFLAQVVFITCMLCRRRNGSCVTKAVLKAARTASNGSPYLMQVRALFTNVSAGILSPYNPQGLNVPEFAHLFRNPSHCHQTASPWTGVGLIEGNTSTPTPAAVDSSSDIPGNTVLPIRTYAAIDLSSMDDTPSFGPRASTTSATGRQEYQNKTAGNEEPPPSGQWKRHTWSRGRVQKIFQRARPNSDLPSPGLPNGGQDTPIEFLSPTMPTPLGRDEVTEGATSPGNQTGGSASEQGGSEIVSVTSVYSGGLRTVNYSIQHGIGGVILPLLGYNLDAFLATFTGVSLAVAPPVGVVAALGSVLLKGTTYVVSNLQIMGKVHQSAGQLSTRVSGLITLFETLKTASGVKLSQKLQERVSDTARLLDEISSFVNKEERPQRARSPIMRLPGRLAGFHKCREVDAALAYYREEINLHMGDLGFHFGMEAFVAAHVRGQRADVRAGPTTQGLSYIASILAGTRGDVFVLMDIMEYVLVRVDAYGVASLPRLLEQVSATQEKVPNANARTADFAMSRRELLRPRVVKLRRDIKACSNFPGRDDKELVTDVITSMWEPWSAIKPENLREFNEVLGSGTFATVTSGEWVLPHSQGKAVPVAIKTFHGSAVNPKHFEREVGLLRDCRHPCIVRLYDAAISQARTLPDSPKIFRARMIMERLEKSLDKALAEGRLIRGAAGLLRALHDAARGVEYLHRHSLLHLDLKPTNILVTSGGGAKVADFGTSREQRQYEQQTLTSAAGTPTFTAPEILQATPRACAASDVFSFGVVICALVAEPAEFLKVRNLDNFARTQAARNWQLAPLYTDTINSITKPNAQGQAGNWREDAQALAKNCIKDRPTDRCTIEMVVSSLGAMRARFAAARNHTP